MNLFNEEFKTLEEAEKIKKRISKNNTPFDKIRQKMINEIINS